MSTFTVTNNAIMQSRHNPEKITAVTYTLLLLFITLYIWPYFRVAFNMPQWIAIRELISFFLLSLIIYKGTGLKLPLWMFLHCASLLGAFFISENYAVAFVTLRTLLQFVVVYVFSKTFVRNDAQTLLFCRFFYVMGFIAVFMILLQAIIGPITVLNMYASLDEASTRFGFVRLTTIFGNTITSAMLELIFLVQILIVNNQNIRKYIMVIGTCLAILLTISKAPIIIMFVIILFYLLNFVRKQNSIKKALMLFFLMFLLIIAQQFLSQLDFSFSDLQYMEDISAGGQLESDAESRFIDKPREGVGKMLDRSPLTFFVGAGFDVAGQAAAEAGGGMRPHNALLEIFMNMGLLGVIVYIYIFYLIARLAIIIKPLTLLDKHLKGLAAGISAALLSALVVDPHVTNVLMVPAFFLLAVAKTNVSRQASRDNNLL